MSDTNGQHPAPTLDTIRPPDTVYDSRLGQLAQEATRRSEIDPFALLCCLTATIGAAIGPTPYTWLGGRRQHTIVWTVLVGRTGAARKSTTIQRALDLTLHADPDLQHHIVSGVGSGEALVDTLRADDTAGRPDIRRIIREHEFARVLVACRREGSTLSAILRAAFDGDPLEARTRTHGTIRVDQHHLTVLGAITPTELHTHLDQQLLRNGFANRVLWVPLGSPSPHLELEPLIPDPTASPIRPAIETARRTGLVPLDPTARQQLEERYATHTALLAGNDTPIAAAHARHWTLTIRVALTHALTDQARHITERHLTVADTLVTTCEQTLAVALRADSVGDPVADRILRSLREDGPATARDLNRRVFGGHLGANQLAVAIARLDLAGLIRRSHRAGDERGGRPTEILHAV